MPPFRSTWVFVITLQPIIILWLVAIAFLVGIAVAAALSIGRNARTVVQIFFAVWFFSSLLLIFVTNWVGVHNFLLEYFF